MVLHCNPLGKDIGNAEEGKQISLPVDALLKADNDKKRSHQKRKHDRAKEWKKVAGAGEDDDVRPPAQRPRRNTAGEYVFLDQWNLR